MLRRLGLAAVVVAAGCGSSGQQPAARPAAGPGRILFSANRTPSVSGEVYRVDPSGRRVDLSRSPFQDTQPAASPDGRRVAFFRQQGRALALWVVGIDGRGAHRVSKPFQSEFVSTFAWAPDSRRIALVQGSGPVSVVTIGGEQRALGRPSYPVAAQWSRDGRLVTVEGRGTIAFGATGGVAWRVPGAASVVGWSSRGLFAARVGSSIAVYDERGRRLFRFPGLSGAWSPDGSLLATTVGRRLEVRDTSGRVIFRGAPAVGLVGWVDATRVGTATAVFDLRTRKRTPAKLDLFDPRSADGSLVATTRRAGNAFSVRVSRLDGSAARTYTRVPGCFDDGVLVAAVEPPQFAGRSRSLVYASHCPEAFDNLYSVAPDGAALRRLTTVKAEETWPVASPDGSRIAFSWSQYTGLSCKGCPSSIRILGGRVLTSPQDAFDLSPSWSPDGKEILFSRSSATSPGELMVVPAGGGEARDLTLVGSWTAWGPSRIAFIDQLHSPPQLKTANPDGSDVRVVTSADVLAPPAWSADGRLAYLIRAGVVVVAADGRAAAPVKLPFERVQTIAWSPDGTRWVVVAQQRGQATTDVYTVRTDGTDVRRITRNVAATSASWR